MDGQEFEVVGDDEGDAEQAIELFILQEVNKLLANTYENVSLSAFQVKTIRQILDKLSKKKKKQEKKCPMLVLVSMYDADTTS